MIEIYTKDQCIYCMMAKAELTNRGLDFKQYELGKDFTREEVLSKFSPQSTYPFIVIDNKLVGGYTDLMEHFKGV
jgi:glutaredoxin 3